MNTFVPAAFCGLAMVGIASAQSSSFYFDEDQAAFAGPFDKETKERCFGPELTMRESKTCYMQRIEKRDSSGKIRGTSEYVEANYSGLTERSLKAVAVELWDVMEVTERHYAGGDREPGDVSQQDLGREYDAVLDLLEEMGVRVPRTMAAVMEPPAAWREVAARSPVSD